MRKIKIISLICAIAMLFSVVSVSAATFGQNKFYNGTDDSVAIDYAMQYTDYTGTRVDCMKLTSVAGNYGKAADDKVYKFEGFNDDSKGTHNYLSFQGDSTNRYVFNLRTQVCLTEQTTKLWYRMNINKTLISFFVINADGSVVTTDAAQIAAADQNKTLGTLSKNQWHNIDMVTAKDATAVTIYLDGVANVINLNGVTVVGVPEFRVAPGPGLNAAGTATGWGNNASDKPFVAYFDNVTSYEVNDMVYEATDYQVAPIASTDASLFTVDGNKITLNADFTVAEFKYALDTTYDVRVYTDATYTTLVSDSANIANGNKVVVENNTFVDNKGTTIKSGALAYYSVGNDAPVEPPVEPDEPDEPDVPDVPADPNVNNTGINTGDKSETVDANTGNASFAANTPGIGGKAASDVVIAFTADDGGRNKNNFDYDLENANLYEFSAFIPSNYDHWFEVMPTYYNASNGRTTAARFVRVHKDKVVLYGVETVTIAITPNAWHNIAIVAPAAGGDTFWVYVDGVAYGLKVADGFTKMAWVQMFKTGIADLTTIYLDNIRVANDVAYHTAKDAIPAVSTEAEDIIIKSSTIEYKSGEASGTVADLKAKLAVSETANIRVYADNTYTTILDDTANVASGNVVVVADTYGYDTERAFAYYTVRPYNGTIFAIEVLDEEAKTAKVTGFNEDNLTEVDDLSSIAIPSEIAGYTIVEIGVAAFAGNVEIQSVSIPDTVTKISRLAFAGSNDSIPGNIKAVKVSKNLKVIEDAAFRYQKSLTAFEFPEGLTTIGTDAFYASAIQKVSLPDTVTFLGDDAFRRCSITYLKLSAGVTEYPNQFYAASILLETLVIPATVTLIGDQAITDMTQYPIDPVVYGVIGTYAQEYAAANNFKFESIVGGTIVAEAGIFGDGVKELAGTDYDIRYGYEEFVFKASLSNIGTEDTTALAMLVLYDETGAIVAKNIKDVPVGAGKTVAIDDTTDVSVPVETLKDGYTVKAMVWTKANNEPMFEAIEYEFDADKKELHVLSIANSFGNDAFGYLPAVAEADGVVIKTYNMYIGGAPITLHYQNLSQNLPAYRPIVNDIYGDWGMTMDEALRSDNWDVVALQAGTHGYSNDDMAFIDYETWADDAEGTKTGTPNITTGEMYEFIKGYVEERVPDAKKVMSMSWGPSEKQAKNSLVYGGKFANEDDPRGAMYDAIEAAYLYGSSIFSEEYGMMVPSAYAIRYALEELGYLEHSGPVSDLEYKNPVAGEVSMFRDETCHLTLPYGRVLVALTWYEYLTGNDVRENPYQMAGISEDVMANLKEAAHWANEQVVPLTGSGN